MNIFIRWIIGLALFLLPAVVHGQQTVTLEEAVELFKENSLQRELAKLDELREKGEAVRYQAYPNPEVSVYREQLNGGAAEYRETTYQISQPVEYLGQPILRNRSASKSKKAAELQFRYDEQRLIRRVKSLYAEYWYLTNRLDVYDEALAVIKKTRESARERESEGTFSGIQVQRFTIELIRYQKARDNILLAREQTGKQLSAFIFSGRDNIRHINIQDTLKVKPLAVKKSVVIQYALSNRPDFRSLELLTQASNLQYKVEKRDRFPDLSINVGYKNQSNELNGFVIGGTIQLPIFNQNSGNVTIAQAEFRSRRTASQLEAQVIRNQVAMAYQRVELIGDRWEALRQNLINASMLEAARAAYAGGRYSLIELLDATKAYVDGRSIIYETIADYNQALFELDVLSAGLIFKYQNN